MLAARFTDLTRLGDSRYIAGPKLDGQRAQAHVRDGRTVASYAWPGRVLLRHPGFVWLGDLAWRLLDETPDVIRQILTILSRRVRQLEQTVQAILHGSKPT